MKRSWKHPERLEWQSEELNRVTELEAKVDALEKRIEELYCRLAWLLEACPP